MVVDQRKACGGNRFHSFPGDEGAMTFVECAELRSFFLLYTCKSACYMHTPYRATLLTGHTSVSDGNTAHASCSRDLRAKRPSRRFQIPSPPIHIRNTVRARGSRAGSFACVLLVARRVTAQSPRLSPAVLLGSHDVQIFLPGSRYVFDSAMQGKKRLESNCYLLLRLVYIVSSDCPFKGR